MNMYCALSVVPKKLKLCRSALIKMTIVLMVNNQYRGWIELLVCKQVNHKELNVVVKNENKNKRNCTLLLYYKV